jgi:hypothetical protein
LAPSKPSHKYKYDHRIEKEQKEKERLAVVRTLKRQE